VKGSCAIPDYAAARTSQLNFKVDNLKILQARARTQHAHMAASRAYAYSQPPPPPSPSLIKNQPTNQPIKSITARRKNRPDEIFYRAERSGARQEKETEREKEGGRGEGGEGETRTVHQDGLPIRGCLFNSVSVRAWKRADVRGNTVPDDRSVRPSVRARGLGFRSPQQENRVAPLLSVARLPSVVGC
jgi:hypothetical protein